MSSARHCTCEWVSLVKHQCILCGMNYSLAMNSCKSSLFASRVDCAFHGIPRMSLEDVSLQICKEPCPQACVMEAARGVIRQAMEWRVNIGWRGVRLV